MIYTAYSTGEVTMLLNNSVLMETVYCDFSYIKHGYIRLILELCLCKWYETLIRFIQHTDLDTRVQIDNVEIVKVFPLGYVSSPLPIEKSNCMLVVSDLKLLWFIKRKNIDSSLCIICAYPILLAVYNRWIVCRYSTQVELLTRNIDFVFDTILALYYLKSVDMNPYWK